MTDFSPIASTKKRQMGKNADLQSWWIQEDSPRAIDLFCKRCCSWSYECNVYFLMSRSNRHNWSLSRKCMECLNQIHFIRQASDFKFLCSKSCRIIGLMFRTTIFRTANISWCWSMCHWVSTPMAARFTGRCVIAHRILLRFCTLWGFVRLFSQSTLGLKTSYVLCSEFLLTWSQSHSMINV